MSYCLISGIENDCYEFFIVFKEIDYDWVLFGMVI